MRHSIPVLLNDAFTCGSANVAMSEPPSASETRPESMDVETIASS